LVAMYRWQQIIEAATTMVIYLPKSYQIVVIFSIDSAYHLWLFSA